MYLNKYPQVEEYVHQTKKEDVVVVVKKLGGLFCKYSDDGGDLKKYDIGFPCS